MLLATLIAALVLYLVIAFLCFFVFLLAAQPVNMDEVWACWGYATAWPYIVPAIIVDSIP